MNTIFVCTTAYNEDDLLQTINSCIINAANPELITFGVVTQYPDKPSPDLSGYKNVKSIKINTSYPLGTSPTRKLAASLIQNEKFFLSIDAHTIFKPNWDIELIESYNNLKNKYNKPVITTYVPYWYRDQEDQICNQFGNKDLLVDMPIYSLRFKTKEDMPPNAFELPTPTWDAQITEYYKEHFLASAHFLFSESMLLQDVPFDDSIVYYEENTLAMRLWTRGYQMFAINKDILWTREMFRGKDVSQSWRQNSNRTDSANNSYIQKIHKGTEYCKRILSGEILGIFGAPDKESLFAYEQAAGIDYKKVFDSI